MRTKLIVLLASFSCTLALAQSGNEKANEIALKKFSPAKAPKSHGLVLRQGDRLAICGDSITEQKMYSRIIEDYLTMCVPELDVTVRQYGWGGERAPGFLARMTNDCLRFKPTIATTCYGMNDHEYRAYEDRIGTTYRANSEAILQSFKAHGVRVIQGSPGCVGKVPGWNKNNTNTLDDLNKNLCHLRNIGIELAEKEDVGFADVFWPMLTGGMVAHDLYGTNYAIAGKDGVHPGWAGHTVMAYAFLKALGLKGEIGTFTVNLNKGKLAASKGHEFVSEKDGTYEVKSTRYPFCSCVCDVEGKPTYPVCGDDDATKDSSVRSGMSLVPFNADLNRFILIAKGGKAENYKVTWGDETKTFTAKQLSHGINLTEEFSRTPFCAAFGKVDAAVAAEQAYETKQIKTIFRSPEAKADMEGVAAKTEQERAPLAEAIKAAFVPVTWSVKIEPL